jgi:hypothetical protein
MGHHHRGGPQTVDPGDAFGEILLHRLLRVRDLGPRLPAAHDEEVEHHPDPENEGTRKIAMPFAGELRKARAAAAVAVMTSKSFSRSAAAT